MDIPTELTTNSPTYRRPGGESSNYYYVLQELTITKSSDYTVRSSTSFPTYGYMYSDSFDPTTPTVNLIGQGQSNADGKLEFTVFLRGPSQPSKRVCIVVCL